MNKNKYGVKTSPQDYYKSVVEPSVSQNQSPIDTPVTYIDDEDVTNYYQGAYDEQYQPKPEAKPLKWYDFIPIGYMVTDIFDETFPFDHAFDKDVRFGCIACGIIVNSNRKSEPEAPDV